jgi:hypothetical protein
LNADAGTDSVVSSTPRRPPVTHPWWRPSTILRHTPLVASHPGWVVTYARGGRRALLRRIVAESVEEARRRELPSSVADILRHPPSTPLGRIGSTQECLYSLVRLARPEIVIETGVYWGLSSSFILAALADNGRGHLYSVDLPSAADEPLPSDEPVGFAVPEPLRDRWTLTLGSLFTEVPRILERLGSVDFYLHDAEHTYRAMRWEFDTFARWAHPGSMLVVDDIDYNAAFDDFSREHADHIAALGVYQNRVGILRFERRRDTAAGPEERVGAPTPSPPAGGTAVPP